MNGTPSNPSSEGPQHNRDEQDSAPSPSEILTIVLNWLKHYWDAPRYKAKWTESATVILTLLIAIAAFYSAWIFQGQLDETRKVFRIDERAWIEIEPIKPTLLVPQNAKFPATFTCNIYPKNAGKTVARDIAVKAWDFSGTEEMGNNAEAMRNIQDKLLLDRFKKMGNGNPVIIPSNPVPKVLAPNSVSPVPFRLTCQAPQVFPNGTQFIHYMIGRIDYCDQFQIKHWLKFCFYVVNARGEVWACKQGNNEDRNPEMPTPETTCGNAN